ncbi:hypothetical protein KFE18_00020 [Clostridiaceae bacterium Marseille-Q4143]|nr:hypothetical protein KFE18_00020 [Clostridiaceae bacterium Marseille-Q4143]
MNVITAFMLVFVVYAIGDIVSVKTKGIITSVFFCLVVYLIGFWTVIPETLFTDTGLMGALVPLLYLLMVNMGTTINIKDFVKQWKTVIIAFFTGLALCCGPVFIAPIFVDKLYGYVAGPILSGAIAAALIMQEAVSNIGRTDLVVFATLILAVQKFIGLPVATICLKSEAKQLLTKYRNRKNEINGIPDIASAIPNTTEKEISEKKSESKFRIRIIPKMPDKYLTNYVIIAKLAAVAFVAEYVSTVITHGKVSSMITCLLLGIIFKEIGFLEPSAMNRANGIAFVYAVPMLSVFSGLTSATPEMLLDQVCPLIIVCVIATVALFACAWIFSKIFKWGFPMTVAVGSCALFGFPTTLILSNEICNAMGDNPEEIEYLNQEFQPKMVISGIVTVTLASTMFAGMVASFM